MSKERNEMNETVVCNHLNMVKDVLQYSGASHSGHSPRRPHSLIRSQMFVTTSINEFTSPSHQRPPL